MEIRPHASAEGEKITHQIDTLTHQREGLFLSHWSEWTNGSSSRDPENQDIQLPDGTTKKDGGTEDRGS